jgi:L-malate glycosyltransferase
MPIPPRILHVVWTLEVGGTERAVFQLVSAQRRHGVEADVAVGHSVGFYGDHLRRTGAKIHEIRQRRALDLTATRRTREVMRRYDIVHFHSAEPTLMGAALTTAARRYYTHRAGVFDYGWKQLARYQAAAALVRAFTGLSANTDHAGRAASRLFRLPRNGIATTYNGIDFDLLSPTRSRSSVEAELAEHGSRFRIATTAMLRPIKRIDLLLTAVAAMQHHDVHCYVLGDGPDRQRLEGMATDLGIADRVHFLGKCDNVPDYLQAMDAFVLPTGHEESFGNALVEAMAMGIPTAIFSDGGGMLEHVTNEDTGFVVRSADELTARLDQLAGDPELRAAIGARGAAAVRAKYTLDRMVAAYDALYGSTG